MEVLMCDT